MFDKILSSFHISRDARGSITQDVSTGRRIQTYVGGAKVDLRIVDVLENGDIRGEIYGLPNFLQAWKGLSLGEIQIVARDEIGGIC